MLIGHINQRKYLYLLCWTFSVLSFCCKTSSKQLKDKHFSSTPTASSSIVRITSHYNKDSLLLLFLTYLPKAHFEITSARNQAILTASKRRSNTFYKYSIEVSDNQAMISGKYQSISSTDNKPESSESYWNVIKLGGGGIINTSGIEDFKVIADAINDAVISYDK